MPLTLHFFIWVLARLLNFSKSDTHDPYFFPLFEYWPLFFIPLFFIMCVPKKGYIRLHLVKTSTISGHWLSARWGLWRWLTWLGFTPTGWLSCSSSSQFYFSRDSASPCSSTNQEELITQTGKGRSESTLAEFLTYITVHCPPFSNQVGHKNGHTFMYLRQDYYFAGAFTGPMPAALLTWVPTVTSQLTTSPQLTVTSLELSHRRPRWTNTRTRERRF